MADEVWTRVRYGGAFWRAHHEAWKRSDLNQWQSCEAQVIPLEAFGNWWARFKAEPQAPERKLLYRQRALSHTLSHSLSHPLSHVAYPSSRLEAPVVPPPRAGHRRRFSQADKRRILDEAATALGAGLLRSLWTVTLPIIWPSIVSIGVFFFVRSMVTLSAVSFLFTPATQLAAVSVLELDESGNPNQAAAFSACIMPVVCLALGAVQLLLRHVGGKCSVLR
jgi:hypothetical protein